MVATDPWELRPLGVSAGRLSCCVEVLGTTAEKDYWSPRRTLRENAELAQSRCEELPVGLFRGKERDESGDKGLPRLEIRDLLEGLGQTEDLDLWVRMTANVAENGDWQGVI